MGKAEAHFSAWHSPTSAPTYQYPVQCDQQPRRELDQLTRLARREQDKIGPILTLHLSLPLRLVDASMRIV